MICYLLNKKLITYQLFFFLPVNKNRKWQVAALMVKMRFINSLECLFSLSFQLENLGNLFSEYFAILPHLSQCLIYLLSNDFPPLFFIRLSLSSGTEHMYRQP